MTHTTSLDSSFSLLLIEAGLTTIALAAAMYWPRLASTRFRRIELTFHGLAARKRFAVASVGLAMLLLRLALLPFFPAPLPASTDDFSFLLAADTFAHGRLANPTPVMWTHFESIHITMQPTYMSMYFPGPGLVMAAGKVLFGHPWAGIVITGAVMCAALCWMLQAWLPPGWALLGGILAILRIGLFGYWVNTYTGGATVSVTGAALVLGAMPRLFRTGRFRYGMLMAAGMALLATSRPFEGMLVCIPVTITLFRWIAKGENRPRVPVLLRRAALPVAFLVAVMAWMGYYDARAFGKPSTLPYTVARATYAVVPYYIWQPRRPIPGYRHDEIRRFYTESEAVGFNEMQSRRGFAHRMLLKLNTTVFFFCGFSLLPPLFMIRRVIRDRRVRFFIVSAPFWIAGMTIGVFLIPHYLAPFTPALYVVGLQAMRHLRQWKPGGIPAGVAFVRLTIVVCLTMAGLRLYAEPLHLAPPQWPLGPWLCTWVGPSHYGGDRAHIADQLDHLPGKHLVLVRYSATHEPGDEWVYNLSDIDGSKTIWARDMDPAHNEELFRYYNDRDIWLVQPDVTEGKLIQYPASQRLNLHLDASLNTGQ
jgi:hypothetical protein